MRKYRIIAHGNCGSKVEFLATASESSELTDVIEKAKTKLQKCGLCEMETFRIVGIYDA